MKGQLSTCLFHHVALPSSFFSPLSSFSLSATANHVCFHSHTKRAGLLLSSDLDLDYLAKPCNPTYYPRMNRVAVVTMGSSGLATTQKPQKVCKELGRKKQQTKQKQQQQQKNSPQSYNSPTPKVSLPCDLVREMGILLFITLD